MSLGLLKCMANFKTNHHAVKKKKKKNDKSNTPGKQRMMGLLLYSIKWGKGKKFLAGTVCNYSISVQLRYDKMDGLNIDVREI